MIYPRPWPLTAAWIAGVALLTAANPSAASLVGGIVWGVACQVASSWWRA